MGGVSVLFVRGYSAFFDKYGSEVIKVFFQELTIEDFREISHNAGVKSAGTKTDSKAGRK
ncbi:MAG: hypothetical protein LBS62_10615 [Clostridiales bacterium]|nr:hypothetical protein [Clostridiales bacterium]